jgi:hypothetical protein
MSLVCLLENGWREDKGRRTPLKDLGLTLAQSKMGPISSTTRDRVLVIRSKSTPGTRAVRLGAESVAVAMFERRNNQQSRLDGKKKKKSITNSTKSCQETTCIHVRTQGFDYSGNLGLALTGVRTVSVRIRASAIINHGQLQPVCICKPPLPPTYLPEKKKKSRHQL